MARIIIEPGKKEIFVDDGDEIKNKAEELGIPFGCRQGRCGTCRSVVIEGMENLFEKNDREIEMGLEENERLCCQAKIKNGTIRIKSIWS